MKQCNKCGAVKELTDFYRDKNYADGFESRCKMCRHGKERPKDRAARLAREGKKWCSRCSQALPVESFGIERRSRDGRKSMCRDCVREWNANEREAHRDRTRARANRYVARGGGRINSANTAARRAGADGILSIDDWFLLLRAYGENCMNPQCDTPHRPLTIDHVIAFRNGGSNTLDNLQLLCSSCNTSKHAGDGQDYRPFVISRRTA